SWHDGVPVHGVLPAGAGIHPRHARADFHLPPPGVTSSLHYVSQIRNSYDAPDPPSGNTESYGITHLPTRGARSSGVTNSTVRSQRRENYVKALFNQSHHVAAVHECCRADPARRHHGRPTNGRGFDFRRNLAG